MKQPNIDNLYDDERKKSAHHADPLSIHAAERRLSELEAVVKSLLASAGGLWRMKDGTVMQIRDLSDGHLASCIKLVGSRSGRTFGVTYGALKAEEARRTAEKAWRETDTPAAPAAPAPATDNATTYPLLKGQKLIVRDIKDGYRAELHCINPAFSVTRQSTTSRRDAVAQIVAEMWQLGYSSEDRDDVRKIRDALQSEVPAPVARDEETTQTPLGWYELRVTQGQDGFRANLFFKVDNTPWAMSKKDALRGLFERLDEARARVIKQILGVA